MPDPVSEPATTGATGIRRSPPHAPEPLLPLLHSTMDGYLDDVDWAATFHSRGSARDMPRLLRALLGTDAAAFVDGYSHLWSTTRREGGAWPATAPTALLYLAAEPEERILMWEDATGLSDVVLDQARLACFDAVPPILPRVPPHLASARPKRRACAAAAVGELARHPSAAKQRPALIRELESVAARADTAYDRASIVIAIGRLGGDTRMWLGDPRPGIHGSAALAPALREDQRATDILIEMSRSPETFNASFGERFRRTTS